MNAANMALCSFAKVLKRLFRNNKSERKQNVAQHTVHNKTHYNTIQCTKQTTGQSFCPSHSAQANHPIRLLHCQWSQLETAPRFLLGASCLQQN